VAGDVAETVAERLDRLAITLPQPYVTKANYIPFVRAGRLAFIAGQGPMQDGGPAFIGKVGGSLDIDQGSAAARLTGLNILSQLRAVCDGDLDRVVRCVRLFGLVNAEPSFTALGEVMDGASNLLVEVFGDTGRHARATIGAVALPHDMAIEIESLFEIA